MAQLTLESGRGKMKIKNFLHLHKHRLDVKPLASFEVAKEMKCTASCTKSEECFSFNVKRLTANSFLCELLNTSKYIDAENLTQDNSFSHYYLQVLNGFIIFFHNRHSPNFWLTKKTTC
jgi:hypothetical protein